MCIMTRHITSSTADTTRGSSFFRHGPRVLIVQLLPVDINTIGIQDLSCGFGCCFFIRSHASFLIFFFSVAFLRSLRTLVLPDSFDGGKNSRTRTTEAIVRQF